MAEAIFFLLLIIDLWIKLDELHHEGPGYRIGCKASVKRTKYSVIALCNKWMLPYTNRPLDYRTSISYLFFSLKFVVLLLYIFFKEVYKRLRGVFKSTQFFNNLIFKVPKYEHF